ncbi:MAG TPA: hypothetical protein DEO86_06940 [Colwellia sp.]|jgi:ankyrin repeat protein|nr:hypothetical protein [Colwellia sp.]
MDEEVIHNQDHIRLLDTVLMEPDKVPALVKENPYILEALNCCDETALHWLAVENNLDGVRLLRSLGANISEWAIHHAIEVGAMEMVILLLELGGEPSIDVCRKYITNEVWELKPKQKRLLISYLNQYGYEL